MADDVDANDSEMFDISTLSEAERRRLRRRQKILGNQGARLQRILTDDPNAQIPKEGTVKLEPGDGKADSKLVRSPSSSSEPSLDEGIVSTSGGGVLAGDEKENTNSGNKTSDDTPSEQTTRKRNTGNSKKTEPSITASLLKELSDPGSGQFDAGSQSTTTREQAPREQTRMGVQSDGTVILPKISNFYGRILICLLALFLSIFNAKRYLITFISWEVAYYFLNGLPPLPPPDMVMVLAAVVGLQENQLIRIKKLLHFGNCVLTDFSLFLVFTLMPHFVRQVIYF